MKKNQIVILVAVLRRRCIELWDRFLWLSAGASQKRLSGGEPFAAVSNLTGPGIEPNRPAPIVMSFTITPTGVYVVRVT